MHFDPWSPDQPASRPAADPWALPYDGCQFPRDERLRHVVFLDGRLVDSWTESVDGSRYQEWADELDRWERRHVSTPAPTPPVHDQVLDWLDGVVGGRVALLALDGAPTRPVEHPDGADERYSEVLEHVRRVCSRHFDDDFCRASEAALVALVGVDPMVLRNVRSAADAAAGLVWIVGRANGAVGAPSGLRQKDLRQTLWLKSWPSHLSTRFQQALLGLHPESRWRPMHCPDLVALGSADFLTCSTRSELVRLRDRALEAAERAWADMAARDVLPPPAAGEEQAR